MNNILFVCTGNTCRSAMAEMYFNFKAKETGLNIISSSAGTNAAAGSKISSLAKQVLLKNKIDVDESFQSTQVSLFDIKNNDLILCMEKYHLEYIKNKYPTYSKKIFLLNEYAGINNEDIPDPIGFDSKIYENIFNLIKKSIDKIIIKESTQ